MKYLAGCGYRLTNLTALIESSDLNSISSKKLVGLTFDDGYTSIYKNALNIIKQFNFSATAFIPADFIGKINTWDHGRFGLRFRHMGKSEMLEWIDAGGEIGCHGGSHLHLKLASRKKRYLEIIDAGKKIQDLLGIELNWFAPPFGWYDRHVLELVRDAGYKGIAVTSGRKSVNCPPGLIVSHRHPVYLCDPLTLVKAKIDRLSPLYHIEDLRLRLIQSGNWGTAAVQALKEIGYNTRT
ncbi:polysaccharide deacetylase family protein [Calditrichota bacterium]